MRLLRKRIRDNTERYQVYGQTCPAAAPIIHLGATSCYASDNAELVLLRDGLDILLKKLATCIARLSHFAQQYRNLPCLAYTHGMPSFRIKGWNEVDI